SGLRVLRNAAKHGSCSIMVPVGNRSSVQPDGKLCPFSRKVAPRNLPALTFNNALRNRKPESGTTPFPRVKEFEQTLGVFGRDSRPVVGYAYISSIVFSPGLNSNDPRAVLAGND